MVLSPHARGSGRIHARTRPRPPSWTETTAIPTGCPGGLQPDRPVRRAAPNPPAQLGRMAEAAHSAARTGVMVAPPGWRRTSWAEPGGMAGTAHFRRPRLGRTGLARWPRPPTSVARGWGGPVWRDGRGRPLPSPEAGADRSSGG